MNEENTQFKNRIVVPKSGPSNEDVGAILNLCQQFRTKKMEKIEMINQLKEYLDNKFKINPIFDERDDDKSIGIKALNIQKELADRRKIIQQCNQFLESVNDDFVKAFKHILIGEKIKQFIQYCEEAKETFEEWVESAKGIDILTAVSLINNFDAQFPLMPKKEGDLEQEKQ